MLLAGAKARGRCGNMRNLAIARGGGNLLFERGRYSARRVSFRLQDWQFLPSVKHFFKKIGDGYVKARNKKNILKIYFLVSTKQNQRLDFFFAKHTKQELIPNFLDNNYKA